MEKSGSGVLSPTREVPALPSTEEIDPVPEADYGRGRDKISLMLKEPVRSDSIPDNDVETPEVVESDVRGVPMPTREAPAIPSTAEPERDLIVN